MCCTILRLVGEGDDAHDAFEIIYRDGNVGS